MNIIKALLGNIDKQEIFRISMENDRKMQVDLLSYGAAIQAIRLPYMEGQLTNVVLSFSDWKDYIRNPLYAGAALGPCSGRIAKGLLPVNDSAYQLTLNDGIHHIHGGVHSISHQNWSIEQTECTDSHVTAHLLIELPDGTDGYPGSRTIHASYSLDNENVLSVRYTATSDCDTYFNLSNHSYFDLSGKFDGTALEQKLLICAERYIRNDSLHIPMETAACQDTHFDFCNGHSIQQQLASDVQNPQLQCARGYNHAFLLKDGKVVLSYENDNRRMELHTDAPAVVVYSGGFIGGSHILPTGVTCDSCAIALEAQDIPDVMHLLPDDYHITKKGQVYERNISYCF